MFHFNSYCFADEMMSEEKKMAIRKQYQYELIGHSDNGGEINIIKKAIKHDANGSVMVINFSVPKSNTEPTILPTAEVYSVDCINTEFQ